MVRSTVATLQNNYKTIIAFSYDALMAPLCFVLSVGLRYSAITPGIIPIENFSMVLLITSLTQIFCFTIFGLYKGIWRFSSTPDLLRVIQAVSVGVAASIGAIFLYNRLENVPRSAFFMDWFVLIVTLGGGRFAYRMWRDKVETGKGSDKVIIAGAGQAGEKLLREIKQSLSEQYYVCAFVDDNPTTHHRTIHGVPVIGKTDALVDGIEKFGATKVFIAIPHATSDDIRRIVGLCTSPEVEIKILPRFSDIVKGKDSFHQLQKVTPTDLLGREAVVLDAQALGKMITGRRVLVSGAGGAIGSELCHQIAKFNPKHLFLFEQCELFLYEIDMLIRKKFPKIQISAFIGDVRDIEKLERVMESSRPDVVFHAAAYKHVPLMEENPREAIYTNVLGTYNLAKLSQKYSAQRFVLISTDKAVNPTNVMGTTKRIAELVCQSMQDQKESQTKFMIVRFGNVLGSSGSVIPLFKKQIEKGGPVTVTHPDIERFFMSIPEATQLVLQAGSMGKGGEIFILEMGAPVKIVDLAKDMITLAGLRPDIDIKIEFIGLRPGEKLYEELLDDKEQTLATDHQKVRVCCTRTLPNEFSQKLSGLFSEAKNFASDSRLRELLRDLVPEYHDPILVDQESSDKNDGNRPVH